MSLFVRSYIKILLCVKNLDIGVLFFTLEQNEIIFEKVGGHLLSLVLGFKQNCNSMFSAGEIFKCVHSEKSYIDPLNTVTYLPCALVFSHCVHIRHCSSRSFFFLFRENYFCTTFNGNKLETVKRRGQLHFERDWIKKLILKNIINSRKKLVCKRAGKSLLNSKDGHFCHCSTCHVKLANSKNITLHRTTKPWLLPI